MGEKRNLYGNPKAGDSMTVVDEYKALIGQIRENCFS